MQIKLLLINKKQAWIQKQQVTQLVLFQKCKQAWIAQHKF